MGQIYSVICKCINVIRCNCRDLLALKNERGFTASYRDLDEWRRIEGVDQYLNNRP